MMILMMLMVCEKEYNWRCVLGCELPRRADHKAAYSIAPLLV